MSVKSVINILEKEFRSAQDFDVEACNGASHEEFSAIAENREVVVKIIG